MYKIEGVDDQRLQALVGKRVQIDGSFDNLDAAREAGNEELVEIDATMVREVAGTCTPAK
jgi:hypothetical protein